MKTPRRRIGGHTWPHRVDLLAFETEDTALRAALSKALVLEVRVCRIDPNTWRFKGGPSRIDITTKTPQALSWYDLGMPRQETSKQ